MTNVIIGIVIFFSGLQVACFLAFHEMRVARDRAREELDRLRRKHAIENQYFAQAARGEAGTCLACGLPLSAHPMPDRIWRSAPDLCAAARARENQ